MDRITRRSVLMESIGGIGAALAARTRAGFCQARETAPAPSESAPRKSVVISVRDADELQSALDRYAGTHVRLRLQRPVEITCRVREVPLSGQVSRHPLLVPRDVHLDLSDSTLLLDLRSNSYGIRLSSNSAIRNGTIRIVRSEGKGSQGIWHSAVCVGDAYDDGGTPVHPGPFSAVSGWAIENLTIDQPVDACAIQLMSEAHHGVIRDIRILDSDKALLGIGMDWGSVGPIATPDPEIPRMRRLWEEGKIYSTHPHDILVEKIRVGRLGRNVDPNDAGVRCSACHNITIRDVQVESAATGVALWGGDCGYEYAPDRHRDLAHSGYLIDGLVIRKAMQFGIVLNGSADNVYRSRLKHGYDALRDPVHPGLNRPVIRNSVLRGAATSGTQGMYVAAATRVALENVDISGFEKGLHVEDWVHGMTFQKVRIAGNKKNLAIEGTVEPPVALSLEGIVEQ